MMPVVVYHPKFKPYRAHRTDAGLDLRSREEIYIPPHQRAFILTGVRTKIEEEWAGLIAPRSGWNKKGLFTQIGVIDSEYRGELGVVMYNSTEDVIKIEPSDRIAQLLFVKIRTDVKFVPEDKIDLSQFENESVRGKRGFGSTGVK